ncbi:MAG: hypothetical protein A2017_19015 [Lentisphaerae bacterium GWF2_44_16]|nr:MAG: hypothetical protein A2017_19015 [Lentisphaerae bacterium GWF2_44_16]
MSEKKTLKEKLKYCAVPFIISVSVILLFLLGILFKIEIFVIAVLILSFPAFLLLALLEPPIMVGVLGGFSYWFFVILIFKIIKDKYSQQLMSAFFVLGLFYFLSFCFINETGLGRGRPPRKALRISCASNLKQIGLAFTQYSMDNDDYFPDKDGAEGLEMLRKNNYLTDYKIYTCPASSDKAGKDGLKEKNISYHYKGGIKASNESPVPILWDRCANHNDKRKPENAYGNVLLSDGSIINYSNEAWKKFCEENSANKK